MISAKLAYRISLGGAAVILLLVLAGLFQPAPAACGDLARNYPAVIAEELARSVGDLQAIFGDAPSACRTALAAKLNLVTLIDSLVFIPAYGAFLLFFFLAMVPRDEHAAFLGFVLSAAAVVADYLENVCLFQITAAPDALGLWLLVLPWATGVKWLGLGLAGAVAGMILIKSGRVNYPAAAACGLAFLGTVVGIANPHLFGPYISNAVTLSWIVFLIVDIRGAFFASTVPQFEVEDGAR
ncbi:MAG: hypothetical protein WDM86_08650 [Rhizomicrobium sp.]